MAQSDYSELDLRWLPPKFARINHDDNSTKEKFGFGKQQAHQHWIQSPPVSESNPPLFQKQQRPRQRSQRGMNKLNGASGGPGMQAIFLGSKHKSCGTGVFIPRLEGTDYQDNNKPNLSPVLMPSRVVQTLNLNVHQVGQQIKPQQDLPKKIMKKIDGKGKKNKNLDDVYRSPEIFLPKEWTY